MGNILVKAGSLFCFTSGEYSDYSLGGHAVALVDITPVVFREVVTKIEDRISDPAWAAANDVELEEGEDWDERHWWWRRAIREEFLPELIRAGVLVWVDCAEIHLGSYGELGVPLADRSPS